MVSILRDAFPARIVSREILGPFLFGGKREAFSRSKFLSKTLLICATIFSGQENEYRKNQGPEEAGDAASNNPENRHGFSLPKLVQCQHYGNRGD
jgi:hypothetical protein